MAATGLFCHVGNFSPEQETSRSYVERMEMFFMAYSIMEELDEGKEEANLVVANRKHAIFLMEIAPEADSTLSNQLVPVKPKDTPMAGIVKALERHYNPVRWR